MFSLNEKNAVVIGGSKGIGKGMAMGLAKAGANLILVSRNEADLAGAAEDISGKTGANATWISADISKVEAISGLVDRIEKEHGQIDILINSAGQNVRKGCLEFNEEDWDQVQNVQLKSVFFMCQTVAKRMIEKGVNGKIINIASVSSIIALKNMISYCTAKGGIIQMTKAFALELAPYGICVNAMVPGYTSTEMTKSIFSDENRVAELLSRIPQKRFGLPKDYEGVAVYLASDLSDYMTGQVIIIDGGWLAS